MAVALEFLSLIIPIKVLHEKYEGGWERCIADASTIGSIWFDEHLLRMGAMSSRDIEAMVQWWKDHGLVPIEVTGGEHRWKDCCVIESPFGNTRLPCDWVEIAEDGQSASLKGVPKTAIVFEPCI